MVPPSWPLAVRARSGLPMAPIHLFVAVAVGLVLMAPAHAQPPVTASAPDDRAISAGRWAVVKVEWDGKAVDSDFLALLHVAYRADGSWAVLLKSVTVAEGKSTTHQEALPKTFEMETLGSEGIQPTRYWGIYKLDGDTRVLCIVAAEKPRPEQFEAPKRSGRMLVTLKRASEP